MSTVEAIQIMVGVAQALAVPIALGKWALRIERRIQRMEVKMGFPTTRGTL